MNLDRHVDGASRPLPPPGRKATATRREKHREFYDEYLAVMDLTAEFYLQTVETVFIRHALPKGEMTPSRRTRRSRRPSAVSRCSPSRARTTTSPASARPRRRTASRTDIPAERKAHYLQPKVGHYGVFNGSRFRAEIAPRIADFIATFGTAPARQRRGRQAAQEQRAERQTLIATSRPSAHVAFCLKPDFPVTTFPFVTSERGMKWFILMPCVRHGRRSPSR